AGVKASMMRGTGSNDGMLGMPSSAKIMRSCIAARTPAELAGRVAGDRRGPEEIFFEEVVEEVLQPGRDAVVVFSAHDREGIGSPTDLAQSRKYRRGGAALVLLIHAVEERQPVLGDVDDVCRVAAPAQRGIEKVDQPDAGSRLAHRAVEDREVQGHDSA